MPEPGSLQGHALSLKHRVKGRNAKRMGTEDDLTLGGVHTVQCTDYAHANVHLKPISFY